MRVSELTLIGLLGTAHAVSDYYFGWQLVPKTYYDEFHASWKGSFGSLLPLKGRPDRPVYAASLRAYGVDVSALGGSGTAKTNQKWSAMTSGLARIDNSTLEDADESGWFLSVCNKGTKWSSSEHKCVLLGSSPEVSQIMRHYDGVYQPTLAQAKASVADKADGDVVSLCPEGTSFGLTHYMEQKEGVMGSNSKYEWVEGCTVIPYTHQEMYVFRIIDLLPGFNSWYMEVAGTWCPPCMWGLADLFATTALIVKYDTPFILTTADHLSQSTTTTNALFDVNMWRDMTWHLRRAGEQPPLFTACFGSFAVGSGFPGYRLVVPKSIVEVDRRVSSGAGVSSPSATGEESRMQYIASTLTDYFGESSSLATQMIHSYFMRASPTQLMRKTDIQASYQNNECCGEDATCVVDFAPCHGSLNDAGQCVEYCPVEDGSCADNGLDMVEGMSECMAAYYSLSKSFHPSRESFSTERDFQFFMGPNFLECLMSKDGTQGKWGAHGYDDTMTETFEIQDVAWQAALLTKVDDLHFNVSLPSDRSATTLAYNQMFGEVLDPATAGGGFGAVPGRGGSAIPFHGNGGGSYSAMIASPDGDVYICMEYSEHGVHGWTSNTGPCLTIKQSTELKLYTFVWSPLESPVSTFYWGGLKMKIINGNDKTLTFYKYIFAEANNEGGKRICKTKPGVTDCAAAIPTTRIPLCPKESVYISEASTWWESVEIASIHREPCSLRGFMLSNDGADFWGQKGYRLDNSHVLPGFGPDDPKQKSILAIRHTEMFRLGTYYGNDRGFNSDGSSKTASGHRIYVELKGPDDLTVDTFMIDRPSHFWTTGILTAQRADSDRNGAMMYAPCSMGFANPSEAWRTTDTVSYLLMTEDRNAAGTACQTLKASNFDKDFEAVYFSSSDLGSDAPSTCTWGSDPVMSMLTNPIPPLLNAETNEIDPNYMPFDIKKAYSIHPGAVIRFLALAPIDVDIEFTLTFGGEGFGLANIGGTKYKVKTTVPGGPNLVAHKVALTPDMIPFEGGSGEAPIYDMPLQDIEMTIATKVLEMQIKHVSIVNDGRAAPPSHPPIYQFPAGGVELVTSGTCGLRVIRTLEECGRAAKTLHEQHDFIVDFLATDVSSSQSPAPIGCYHRLASTWPAIATSPPGYNDDLFWNGYGMAMNEVNSNSCTETRQCLCYTDAPPVPPSPPSPNPPPPATPQPAKPPPPPPGVEIVARMSPGCQDEHMSEIHWSLACDDETGSGEYDEPSGAFTVEAGYGTNYPAISSFNVKPHVGQQCTFTGKDRFGDGWGTDCNVEFAGKNFTVEYRDYTETYLVPFDALIQERGVRYKFQTRDLPAGWTNGPNTPMWKDQLDPIDETYFLTVHIDAIIVDTSTHSGLGADRNVQLKYWDTLKGTSYDNATTVQAFGGFDEGLQGFRTAVYGVDFNTRAEITETMEYVWILDGVEEGATLFENANNGECVQNLASGTLVSGDFSGSAFDHLYRKVPVSQEADVLDIFNSCASGKPFTWSASDTPSPGAGPNIPPAPDYGYWFTEASGGSHKKVFQMEFDGCAPGQAVHKIGFDYHMYSSRVEDHIATATLALLDGAYNTVWKVMGNQDNEWKTVDPIEINTRMFRFSARTGSGWASDIAIGNVHVECVEFSEGKQLLGDYGDVLFLPAHPRIADHIVDAVLAGPNVGLDPDPRKFKLLQITVLSSAPYDLGPSLLQTWPSGALLGIRGCGADGTASAFRVIWWYEPHSTWYVYGTFDLAEGGVRRALQSTRRSIARLSASQFSRPSPTQALPAPPSK